VTAGPKSSTINDAFGSEGSERVSASCSLRTWGRLVPDEQIPLAVSGRAVGFGGEEVILTFSGRSGLLIREFLGSVAEVATGSGYPSIGLDLSDADFLEESDVEAIVGAARRLAGLGGHMTVHCSLAIAGDIATRAGAASWLHFEPPWTDRPRRKPAVPGRLLSEQPVGTAALVEIRLEGATPSPAGLPSPARSSSPAGVPFAAVLEDFGAVSAAAAASDIVDGALRLVVALARAAVGGADGVSVSLRRHGHLSTVAASDQTIVEMDTYQYATGEGPCVDASVEGRWFHTEALQREHRWPSFTPKARALGINAILSSPLTARSEPVGALNIYSRTPSAFAVKDQELAAIFATQTSAILTQVGMGDVDENLAVRFDRALYMREVIAQAQGILMERQRVSANGAYGLLSDFSRRSNRPLFERAEEVVASARRPRSEGPSSAGGDSGIPAA